MAFGNKSDPSKNFSFGAVVPTENSERMSEQMWLAHRYYNAIIEVERNRRQAIADAVRARFPALVEAEARYEMLDQELVVARTAIKQANQSARSKKAGTPEQKAQVKALAAQRKECSAAAKVLRKAAWDDAELKVEAATIEATAHARKLELRAACGLYWGTYLVAETAADTAAKKCRKGEPPRFHRWEGHGCVAVQFQGGISLAELFACGDTRARVELVGAGWLPMSKRGRRRRRYVLWLRIGSGGKGGREPVWAKVPFLMHRELPEGIVKWVKVFRRRVGTQERWEAQFTLANKEGWAAQDCAVDGAVGIDVGWRKLADGSVRVASWVGSDGEQGELRLSDRDVGRWWRVDTLQSTRDGNFNRAKAELLAWLGTAPALPEWWAERARLLSQWRSQRRLAGLALFWANNRFENDGEAFASVAAWQKQDRHLYDWQEFQRRKTLAWRKHLYRNFVADLRRRYHTAAIEDANWAKMQQTPEPEQEQLLPGMTTYRRMASVGNLLEIVKQGFASVSRVAAEWTTQTCAACGECDEFDAAAELVRTCQHCGNVMDQDERAARNLLAASGEVMNQNPVIARVS